MKHFSNLQNSRLMQSIFTGAIMLSVPFFIFAQKASADSVSTTIMIDASSTEIVVVGDSCAPSTAAFNEIQAIQNDPTLSYLDEIKSELAARRSLLSQTIVCAKSETESLKANLNDAVIDPSFQVTRSQLSDKLDSSAAYYDIELAKVNTAGIGGTKAIAKEILAWRAGTYAPLAANVSNFILWSENQTLFSVADDRLAQIGNLAASVPFSENSQLQSDFQAATVSLQTAESKNSEAKLALAQSVSSDQSLALIQQSLDALSSTYQHFFDISTLVATLLPH